MASKWRRRRGTTGSGRGPGGGRVACGDEELRAALLQLRAMRADRYPEIGDTGGHCAAALRGTMLITQDSPVQDRVERRSIDRKKLAIDVKDVLEELDRVRTDIASLLEQRNQLEAYVKTLRSEVERLRAEKVHHLANRGRPEPALDVTTIDARDSIPGATEPPAPMHRSGRRRTDSVSAPAPAKAGQEDAFRAFLLADVDHDKSREWFLSNQG